MAPCLEERKNAVDRAAKESFEHGTCTLSQIPLKLCYIADVLSNDGELDYASVFYLAPFKESIEIGYAFSIIINHHIQILMLNLVTFNYPFPGFYIAVVE